MCQKHKFTTRFYLPFFLLIDKPHDIHHNRWGFKVWMILADIPYSFRIPYFLAKFNLDGSENWTNRRKNTVIMTSISDTVQRVLFSTVQLIQVSKLSTKQISLIQKINFEKKFSSLYVLSLPCSGMIKYRQNASYNAAEDRSTSTDSVLWRCTDTDVVHVSAHA